MSSEEDVPHCVMSRIKGSDRSCATGGRVLRFKENKKRKASDVPQGDVKKTKPSSPMPKPSAD